MLDEQREAKLTEAMDLYGDYVVQLCYTYVRNWQTAEDLAQDTFIKYYEALPKFRGEASVKTYIFRIAVNTCHNYLTSWKHRKVHISQLFQKLLTSNDTPESRVVYMSEQHALVGAIEALPTKYKDVLVLYHFAELSLQDISLCLKLPINTVKTRLRRARQTLGVKLCEEEELYESN